MNKLRHLITWTCLCFLLFFCSCAKGRKQLDMVLESAGNNRGELESVLQHYKGDSLKYQAACYLIEHMPGCYAYNDPRIDSLKVLKWLAVQKGEGAWLDSVKRIWDSFSYSSMPKVYDVEVITADYLIEHIDHAFEVWDSRPWVKYYTFEDFCRYVLPYRVGNEPLESWRKLYYDRYVQAIDSMYGGSDIVEAAQAIRTKFLNDNFAWDTNFSLPHFGACYLLDHRAGICRESCDFTVYLFRSLGIPVATDCYLSSPQTNGPHSWTILKDTTGMLVPFWLVETDVKRGGSDGRPKGKVFRREYWGKMEDVTSEYFGKNKAEIKVTCPSGIDDVYLCVFSCSRYTAVDKARLQGGKVTFYDLEPGIWFLPMYKEKDRRNLLPAGYAFSLNKEGEVKSYIPDTLQRRRAVLQRKYSFNAHLKEVLSRMSGSRIEGSWWADFRHSIWLGSLDDSIRTNRIEIFPSSEPVLRYLKLRATPLRYTAEVAEIEVYEAGTGRKLPLKFLDIPAAISVKHAANMMVDGDVLSYYEAAEEGEQTLSFDLKNEYRIGKVVFIPRNDDNFIYPGDEYELFYQDGINGWKSLGRQIAVTYGLEYNNIPSGALLWLRDLTRGREEQLFVVTEDGRQKFL